MDDLDNFDHVPVTEMTALHPLYHFSTNLFLLQCNAMSIRVVKHPRIMINLLFRYLFEFKENSLKPFIQ